MIGNSFICRFFAACLLLLAGFSSEILHAADAPETIVLASTTSVDNSGLLAAILPGFTAATGIMVRVLGQGTGHALDTARRGDADLVLVHNPEAEQKFIAEGHGINRRQIAWNDFILVGPTADPAHVAGGHDAVAALAAIARAQQPFVSRGDRSGTNELERRLWTATGIDPESGRGTWYFDMAVGMGKALEDAAAMPAYTLSDRGTWISFKNKAPLKVVVEEDPKLVNRYVVIELDPAKHPSAKLVAAHRLAEWLVSPVGQKAIGDFVIGGEQPFHPSAAELR